MAILTFRQQAACLLLLFVFLLILVPQTGYEGDADFWVRWATYSFEHRLGDVYQLPDNNYNPLYHYILWLYGHLAGNVEKIVYYRHYLKAFTLVFDFAGALWAASLAPERSRRFGLALLLLLNAGYLYNTLIWMQVDSIYTCFSFGAVVLAARRHTVGSVLCFVLALAAKTQAIIFLPPLGLLWAPAWWQRPLRLVQAGLAGAALAVLVLAPFIWGGWTSALPRIIQLNLTASEVYPKLSMNAFNIWYLITDFPSLDNISDQLPYLAGLTYRSWGLIWFMTASAVALLPLLVAAWQSGRRGLVLGRGPGLGLVLVSCGIIPLLFTFLNTQMHERYWHAAVLFLAGYAFVRRDYLPFGLVSVAYFLHLERNLAHLQLMHYDVLLFKQGFIAALFGLTIVVTLIKIYRLAPWGAAWQRPAPAAAAPLGAPAPAGLVPSA